MGKTNLRNLIFHRSYQSTAP